MTLFYRKFGEGPPLIILHGLYGSSDNWITIGRALSEHFEVWLPDQRNHGRSPHNPEHNYEVMQADLLEFMNEHKIDRAILIGHSMGGKTVMKFAVYHPERISHLIVVDIAPKSYLFSLDIDSDSLNHRIIMEAMLYFDFNKVKQRGEIDEMLAEKIKNKAIRQFLLKNVVRKEDRKFGWGLNIEALHKNLNLILNGYSLSGSTTGDEITGFPVLFIKGGDSDYISEDDKELIERIFPYSQFQTIPDTGHWLHAEKPDVLLRVLRNFIS